MKRRSFIKISGLVGGSLMMSLGYPLGSKANPRGLTNELFKLNTFLTIDTKGEVTFLLTKQEMGQGVDTGLAMILAEELGADWATLKIKSVEYSSAIPGYQERFGIMETGGSTSIDSTWLVLRKAGATVREMLLTAAANGWGVDKTSCFARNGKVVHAGSNRTVDFGNLVEAASQLPVPQEVALKDKKDFSLIGQSLKSKKAKKIVQGDLLYSMDVDLPGMLYASVFRSPVVGGKVDTFDATRTKEVSGVIDVVKIEGRKGDAFHWQFEDGVAVIADSTWAAIKGRRVLEVEWRNGTNENKNLDHQRTVLHQAAKEKLATGIVIGNSEKAIAEAVVTMEVAYEVPFLSHVLMEPLNATAAVKNGACEIWAGTQSPQYTSLYLSQLLDIPLEKITFHTYPSGGGFGRRFFADFVAEAALLSQQLGSPVKVMWTREDEIQNGRFHSFRHDHYKVGIDKKGELTGIEFKGISTWFRPANSFPVYPIPTLKEEHKIVESIVNTGPWRSVTAHPEALGKECMIDEVAQRLKQDPIDFRLALLKKEPVTFASGADNKWFETRNRKLIPKYVTVLKLLKEKSRWGKSLPEGYGRGVAIHEFGDSVCGQVVEVSVNDEKLLVSKIYCVLDCGLVINPHFVIGQVEGSIIWALSAVLYGGVDVQNGKVQQSNFHNNKVLRIDETPEITVFLMGDDDQPGRVGEAAVPPLAPAVLNAIYHASGKRIRKIPVTKSDLARTADNTQ